MNLDIHQPHVLRARVSHVQSLIPNRLAPFVRNAPARLTSTKFPKIEPSFPRPLLSHSHYD